LLCPFVEDCSTEELTTYACQQTTGALLLEMMPRCEASLRQTLRRSLPVWNLSVEQWSYYLCRCFGIDAVAAAIDEIADVEELDHIEREAVDTLRYWLRAKPDAILGTSAP
jgi:hypothetical protein